MSSEGDEEINKFVTVDEEVKEPDMLLESAVVHVKQAKV